ncbi:hypothetical protein C1701_05000 [Actinoalloteichus sp. AHMU CJ021]|uniref:MftR C-terminal domain-containing protein n=1 Tax=Actinoalloteichus caeruleus DSM 43889 TaxID=1120930 RepID=A0ABT1JJ49_ACTCY|nr:hypothetical protein [Actinoalloteichus caeruleus]AUS77824.1 hypothetical protein C1701_05000 [Actinoalloteichus sp. AHMU CJ021]MCP2331781.1 hypothetical protein [Actinoalloteichus caeruleus DSM 43889]
MDEGTLVMTDMVAVRDALVDQLSRVVQSALLDPLAALLGRQEVDERLAPRMREEVDRWADDLLGEDQHTARSTAVRLVFALYPGAGPFDPPATWWRTPFGQAVARTVGHPTALAVSYPVAAAMMGLGRREVHDLALRGVLDRHPDGGITTASVRAMLNRQSRRSS